VRSVLKQWSVREFGASGDCSVFDTRSIQAAIDHAAVEGGVVHLPAGVYLTAPLRLRSNITLDLDRDAVLLGSPNIEDRVLDGWPAGVLFASDARNVAITGQGTLDGNYRHFFDLDRVIPTTYFRDFDPAAVRGGRGFDEQPSADGPVMPRKRPGNMLVFSRCENLLIEGVRITGSSMWTVHCADCRQVTIRDIDLTTDQRCYNTDGIHLTDCQHVSITGCEISTGDDCVAISGQRGTSDDPRDAAWEPEIALGFSGIDGEGADITVSDCRLSSKSSAVRIWSLQSSVRDVRLRNLAIHDTNRGIGIFLRSPHTIADVSISDVNVETRFHTGAWWGWAEPLHISAAGLHGSDVASGKLEGIRVRGLHATSENGIVVYGHVPGVVRDISLEDVHLRVREGEHTALKAGHLDLRNTDVAAGITQRASSGFTAVNVESLRARGVQIDYPAAMPPHFVPGPVLENIGTLDIEDWRQSTS
jgi:hypothetical protein